MLSHLAGESSQQDPKYLKDLCTCISAIAVVEVPVGLWAGFVGLMTEQANQNENIFFKLAATMTLGYM